MSATGPMRVDKNGSMLNDPEMLATRGVRETENGSCRTRFGTFPECPLCGGALAPEHAHFKCRGCGWRDSCCD